MEFLKDSYFFAELVQMLESNSALRLTQESEGHWLETR